MAAVMGIDIGGSGIKGAPVDTATGEFLVERKRIETPSPATPDAVLGAVRELTEHFEWSDAVGCAFPGVVRAGTVLTAANLDAAWIGVDLRAAIAGELGVEVAVLNDADAAGVAEMRFGPSDMAEGTVVMLTLGTGIGSAVFTDGHLVANTELGHLDIRGTEAEHRAAARVRNDLGLTWKDWAARLTEVLEELERLLWPDRFVIGGGVSRKFEKYGRFLAVDTPVRPARMLNTAGVVGAALAIDGHAR